MIGLNLETMEAQVYNLNAGTSGQTISVCRGLFRDSGGGDIVDCILGTGGNYGTNENRTVTFCSNNGKPIRVSFLWWDLETGFDVITVYDGPNTSSPVLIAFTGFGENYQVPNFYTSSGTCLTFRFTSDNTVNWCGWEAIIGCEPDVCGTGNNPPANDACSNAPTICDFDGYCGNTSGWYTPDNSNIGTTGTPPGPFCGSIENNSWVSFIADETSASFRITSSNCIFPIASGIQAQIFSAVNCSQFTSVSNCVSQDGGPGTFNISTTSALVPGQRYYIMLDGFGGNVCDYTIFPLTGVRALDITGPPYNSICTNQTTTLTVTGANPGDTYQWSPASAIIGASNGPSITANPGATTTNYSVVVTSPSGCASQTLNYNLIVNSLNTIVTGNTTICEGESTTLMATATPNPATVSFNNNLSVNIPDNNATGITSNINVTGISGNAGATLESVCLDISHTFVGDLEVLLRCPNGTTINLSTRRGGGGDNYSSTCFGLSGPAISTGTPPFTGTFTPEQALSALAACTSDGTWSLIVRDRLSGDTGALLGWSINFKNEASYTWSPSTGLNTTTGPSVTANPTTTTSYTITTQDMIGCSSQTSVTVTVNPNTTPVFNPIANICQGSTPPALPNVSTNGISGTWSPASINTGTPGSTTYTFTPSAGQCANNGSISVTIDPPSITPTFNPITPICSGDPAPILPTTSNNGITGTWTPPVVSNTATNTYNFTPNAGQCASPSSLVVTVNPANTPTFNPITPICSGDPAPILPTTSNNGITGTWSPAVVSNTTTNTYTFTPNAGQCASSTSLVVTVNPANTPTFNPITPICSGDPAPILPTISTNGINGTWSPTTVSNTNSATYTFTPFGGQCANQTTLNITVNTPVTPTFNPVTAICQGATPPTLPTTSTNGITGTWSPATVNNTSTTTYTFTPTAGQCATSTTLVVNVNNNTTPLFNPIPPLCSGDPAPVLPVTSTNGISGTWSPATVSNSNSATYTFIPSGGQCAIQTTFNVTVNPRTLPTFNPIPPFCEGTTAPTLPLSSTNGITGTWSPPFINNSTSGTYTFIPGAGQCADQATLNTTVTSRPITTLIYHD